MIEQPTLNRHVVSLSSPSPPFIGSLAQLVRALACHARGRRFEPGRSRHYKEHDMNKRTLLYSLSLLPFLSNIVNGQQKKAIPSDDDIMWKVPDGIKKIHIRSWSADGDEIMNRYISVKPGQVFKINVVKK